MALSEDNSKTYLRQMDQEEVAKDFFPLLGDQGAVAALWRKGQDDPYQVRLYAPAGAGAPLRVEVPDKVREIFRTEYQGVQVFLKVSITQEKQFFTSGTMDVAASALTVRVGSPVFVTTKRSACRYMPGPNERITLSLLGHTLPCYDISSGGFSTQVPRGRYAGLEKGQIYELAELRYSGKLFKVPKVRVVAELDVTGRPELVRFAFKFENLKPSDEDAIWVEVNNSIKRTVHLT